MVELQSVAVGSIRVGKISFVERLLFYHPRCRRKSYDVLYKFENVGEQESSGCLKKPKANIFLRQYIKNAGLEILSG